MFVAQHRRSIALLVTTGLLVVLLAAFFASRTPRFSDFPEALRYAIEQRGVAVEQVWLSRGFADTLTDEVFSANLEVQTIDGDVLPGRIECKLRRINCRFTVVRAGIYRVPLPDLVVARPIGWLEWLERQVAELQP